MSIDLAGTLSEITGRKRKSSNRSRKGHLTKRWKAIFSTKRLFEDDLFFKVRESITSFERDGGPLDAFLEDAESSIPSWETTIIREFLRARKPHTGPVRDLARARLDDREHSTGKLRANPEWLTSGGLRDFLSLPRFGASDIPDADRRLIYIHRPDPEYLLTLIESVYCHQADALRDTLWKYISYKTSIRVTSPLFDKFVLEFHLPFLALRRSTLSSAHFPADCNHHIIETKIDVSFLNLLCPEHQSRECMCKHIIEESQVSVVISGWDNQNWVGWGLFNTTSDPTDEHASEDERELNEDYYAADGEDGPVINADDPIWDPRHYWLRIIDGRVRLVLKESIWLVRNIEAGVITWKSKHPILSAQTSKSSDREEVKELFDWTIQTMQLLRQLRERIARTTQAWARFSSSDGDQCFFTDIRDLGSLVALTSLRLSFQELEDLQQDLASLDKSCEESKAILRLCLEHENNRVNLECREISRHAQSLNYATNVISRDIQGLNRQGTNAAIQTGRSTRANVLAIWITTPLVLALQYFGAEKDIFPFERNIKSFMIALILLLFALPCLTYGLDSLGYYIGSLCTWTKEKPEDSEANQTDTTGIHSHVSVLAGA